VTTALDSGTTHETYSDLFKVVGILLRDQLTTAEIPSGCLLAARAAVLAWPGARDAAS
jgi:hypothetical protein